MFQQLQIIAKIVPNLASKRAIGVFSVSIALTDFFSAVKYLEIIGGTDPLILGGWTLLQKASKMLTFILCF